MVHVLKTSEPPGLRASLYLLFWSPAWLPSRAPLFFRFHGCHASLAFLKASGSGPDSSCVCSCSLGLPVFGHTNNCCFSLRAAAWLPAAHKCSQDFMSHMPSQIFWRPPGLARLPRVCPHFVWASWFPGIPINNSLLSRWLHGFLVHTELVPSVSCGLPVHRHNQKHAGRFFLNQNIISFHIYIYIYIKNKIKFEMFFPAF